MGNYITTNFINPIGASILASDSTGNKGVLKALPTKVIYGTSTNTTDEINDALLNGSVHVLLVGEHILTAKNTTLEGQPYALKIFSNSHLELQKDAKLKFDDSVTIGPNTDINTRAGSIIVNSAYADTHKFIYDASITSGEFTFFSSDIEPSDVGKNIWINGAGSKGVGTVAAPLFAEIITATNGSCTLSIAATTSVSVGLARIYNNDENIEISGGVIDRNLAGNPINPSSTGYYNAAHSVILQHVKSNLYIHDILTLSKAGKYSFFIGNVKNPIIENMRFDCFSDGLHFIGPISGGYVEGVRGSTGDDHVALFGTDYVVYGNIIGDISDVRVEDIMMDTSVGRILLCGAPGHKVRNIHIKNIKGKCRTAATLASGIGDAFCIPEFNSDVSEIYIDDVEIYPPQNGYGIALNPESGGAVHISNYKIKYGVNNNIGHIRIDGKLDSLTIDGFYKSRNANAPCNPVSCSSNTVIKRLSIRNVDIPCSDGSAPSYFLLVGAGKVYNLAIDGYYYDMATYTLAGSCILLSSGGVISTAVLNNIQINKGKAIIVAQAGSSLGPITLSNYIIDGSSRILDSSVQADITIGVGRVTSPLSSAIYAYNASVTVRGSGCYIDTSIRDAIELGGTGGVHVKNLDFPCDTAKMVSPVVGDKCLNYNASSPPLKAGPAIFNGTVWKSLLDLP